MSVAANGGRKSSARRFSMAKSNSISHPLPESEEIAANDLFGNTHSLRRMSWKKNPDIFGSVISLADDENIS